MWVELQERPRWRWRPGPQSITFNLHTSRLAPLVKPSQRTTQGVLDCRLTLEPSTITLKCLRKWMSVEGECIVFGNTRHSTVFRSLHIVSLKHGRAVLLSFTGRRVHIQVQLSFALSLPHCLARFIRYGPTPDHLLKSALSWWAAGGERETERTGIL